MTSFSSFGVVGCGLMGAGIVELVARSGFDVLVADTSEDALNAGKQRILSSLARAEHGGKISSVDRERAWQRLRFTTDLHELAMVHLVFEAITEDVGAKTDLLAQLDGIVNNEAVFASNTSTIPIITLATATRRPKKVIGVHFFNPVPVLPLVELISSLSTDPDIARRVEELVTVTFAKRVIHAPDRAGFIVNALLIPYLLSAIRMFEAGVATKEDIDAGMEVGCAHPMGPLRLADFIGLDTVQACAESLLDEFNDPASASPPLLRRMVAAGRLGQKSGQGFYHYEDGRVVSSSSHPF